MAERLSLIPPIISPIGIYFQVALGLSILMLAIVNAILDPQPSCSEDCPEVKLMDALAKLVAVGALSMLFIGAAGPLIFFSIMIAYLAFYFTGMLL